MNNRKTTKNKTAKIKKDLPLSSKELTLTPLDPNKNDHWMKLSNNDDMSCLKSDEGEKRSEYEIRKVVTLKWYYTVRPISFVLMLFLI